MQAPELVRSGWATSIETSMRAAARALGTAVASLRRSRMGCVGALLLAVHVGLALFGPLLAPHNYAQFNTQHLLEPPSWAFWAGTDQFGRDQLSRVIWGARATLVVAATSTVLGVTIGVLLGMLAGLYGGFVDELLMRVVDALLALPSLLLAMLILATLGASSAYVVAAISVVFVPRAARVIRGVALSLAASEFIDAARVRGESVGYVIFRELLPNAWAPIVVEVSIRFGYAILLASSLGFLGLGAAPPAPDWGLMINEALPFLDQAPWLIIAPAAAISTVVVAANLVGDTVREALAGRGLQAG